LDQPEHIKQALLEAAESSDIVVINAGSSAGSKDYTVHIIEELGTVYTHGVAARPGKPAILGKINGAVGRALAVVLLVEADDRGGDVGAQAPLSVPDALSHPRHILGV
jgi:molybdopterin biosynthesis enzyme